MKQAIILILKIFSSAVVASILLVSIYIMSYSDQGYIQEISYLDNIISDSQFLQTVKYGSINDIQEVLEIGVNIHATDSMGRNALINAVLFNSYFQLLPVLIKYGSNINHKDVNGYDALMLGIIAGKSRKVIDFLLSERIDVNHITNSGISTLMLAVSITNSVSIVEDLLKKGANINYVNASGVTPLMMAAKVSTNPDIIKLLMRYGADHRHKDIDGIAAYDLFLSNEFLNEDATLKKLLKI